MLYELKIMESKREARSEGIELATKLYVKLIEDGRFEDAKKAGEDPEYREQLFREYGLEEDIL